MFLHHFGIEDVDEYVNETSIEEMQEAENNNSTPIQKDKTLNRLSAYAKEAQKRPWRRNDNSEENNSDYWNESPFTDTVMDDYSKIWGGKLSQNLEWKPEYDQVFTVQTTQKRLIGYKKVKYPSPKDEDFIRKKLYTETCQDGIPEKAKIMVIADNYGISDQVYHLLYEKCDVRELVSHIFHTREMQLQDRNKMSVQLVQDLLREVGCFSRDNINKWRENNTPQWEALKSLVTTIINDVCLSGECEKNKIVYQYTEYARWLITSSAHVSYNDFLGVIYAIWHLIDGKYYAYKFVTILIHSLDYMHVNHMESERLIRIVDMVGRSHRGK